MGRSKRREEGQYVPLYYAQLKSEAWRSLSGAAVKVLRSGLSFEKPPPF